jgi:dCMP deaminase
MRPDFDTYYLAGAEWASTRADCTRAQVGALLVSRDHRVTPGYNGLPSGIPGCASAGNCPRGRLTTEECARDSNYANCAARHAEDNAITRARPEDLLGATLYVTRAPCPSCQTLIKAAGIARVVTPGGDFDV